MELSVDKKRGIARIVFSGPITPGCVIDAVNRMLDHPDFVTDMPSLWDYRDCNVGEFTAEDLRRIGEFAHQTVERNNSARIAIVVNGDLQYGLTRMFVMMNEITHLEFVPFRDYDAAERWALDDAVERF